MSKQMYPCLMNVLIAAAVCLVMKIVEVVGHQAAPTQQHQADAAAGGLLLAQSH